MPRELRKRKAPVVEPDTAPVAKKATKKGPVAKAVAAVQEVAEEVKEAVEEVLVPKVAPKAKTNGKLSASKIAVGSTIDLEGFGGEIETHEGEKTNLKKLLDESKAGVVLFTYPKASTAGCTKQACQFRDQYTPLTATGLSIYGLSKDTPKSNSSFKEKQKLPYPLLCDPKGTLIKAITLLKSDGKITRGVFVIDKSGKIFAAEGGSPSGTVDVVERLIKSGELTAGTEADGAIVASKEDVAKAEIAADVADTAEKLDRV